MWCRACSLWGRSLTVLSMLPEQAQVARGEPCTRLSPPDSRKHACLLRDGETGRGRMFAAVASLTVRVGHRTHGVRHRCGQAVDGRGRPRRVASPALGGRSQHCRAGLNVRGTAMPDGPGRSQGSQAWPARRVRGRRWPYAVEMACTRMHEVGVADLHAPSTRQHSTGTARSTPGRQRVGPQSVWPQYSLCSREGHVVRCDPMGVGWATRSTRLRYYPSCWR